MKLYRAFATVGGLTLVSRVLGFLRDILFAWAFGAGWVADAFNVAFRFPNLFRRLFGEGAFNSAFIPLFAKELEGNGREEARGFAEEAMSGLVAVLVALTIVAILGMPWLMYLLAPGFSASPEKFDLAVLLTQITFPYLLCMSLVALFSGVLNTFGKFVESSSVSIVLNLTLAAAIFVGFALGYHNESEGGIVQAIGVFVAGVLQLWLLIDGLRRNNFTLKLRRPRMTERVRRLITLGIPGIIAGGVTQLNIMIGTVIASQQPGAVSQLYYADRLYELPLAIVGIAIGVVLLPDVSRQLRAGNHAGVLDSQNRSLEFAMLLTVPAAVALAVVPEPIVKVLFERGAFMASDTAATAAVLAIFALGLPSFVMIKVFSPAYFAREDTQTPMRYATISLVANTVGSVVLFYVFREAGALPQLGIAVATTLGGWLNAGLLWGTLVKRGHFVLDRRMGRAFASILIASVVMGAALIAAAHYLAPFFATERGLAVHLLALSALVGAGLAVYAVIVLAAGTISLRHLSKLLRRG
ncbi:MAG: murein biosynthesis integral membrane protein MurJ [Hyphomicrobium sp.]|uniref:murein biosynthesis integral membrane protein MurJ n=1 Tax=Hyphomicrobium sp. TaxID=82 RepID=UPI003D13BCB1